MIVVAVELSDDLAISLQALSTQARSTLVASALRTVHPNWGNTPPLNISAPSLTAAELLDALRADGALDGYGDSTEDASLLARRLRDEFSHRQTDLE